MPEWLLIAVVGALALYLLFVLVLLVLGEGAMRAPSPSSFRAASFYSRGSWETSGSPAPQRVVLALLVVYLALPFDLVRDFIPVAGQLDDAIVVMLVLRTVLRGAGPSLIREHWPGPDSSLAVILRLSGVHAGSRPA